MSESKTRPEAGLVAEGEEVGGRRWPRWEIVCLAAIALLGLLLRLHQDTAAPLITDNDDELQFTWLGLNLIVHHAATTWSYFPGYPAHTVFRDFGKTYPMVNDWLDHPPLFGYILGGFAWLLGDRTMTQVTAAQVRFLPVIFSSATIPLLHVFGRQLIDRRASLVAALLLATSPAAVLMGREGEPESLQAVLLLGSLLLTLWIVKRGRPGALSLGFLILFAVACPFMKVSGVAVGGICLVILFAFGHWRSAIAVLAGCAAGLLLYVLYGWIVDWHLFTVIWSEQVAHREGVMGAFQYLAFPSGINRELQDGWWLLGWIGLAILLSRRSWRRELFLVWPAFAYAATMLLMAGQAEVEQYGWYKVIIYPEVYLGAGCLAWYAVRERSLPALTALLVLGGATATNWWLGGTSAGWVPSPALLVIVIGAVLVPAAIAAWRRSDGLWQEVAVWAGGLALGVIVLGNTVESLLVDAIFTHM